MSFNMDTGPGILILPARRMVPGQAWCRMYPEKGGLWGWVGRGVNLVFTYVFSAYANSACLRPYE